MNQQTALADLKAVMKLRLEEFDTAIDKLDGIKRSDPGYGELFEARWEAAEAYEKAYDAWNDACNDEWRQEKKKHPAVTAAGCDETKTNGKQGNDFNV